MRKPSLPASLDKAVSFDVEWYGLLGSSALDVPVAVYDLSIDECVWRDVDASGRTFSGLRARDVVFEGCDFSGAVLDGAVLDRVAFRSCRLTGLVLSGASLTDVAIDGGVADLASFRSSRCTGLQVTSASLKSADFYAAVLKSCSLLDCDLSLAAFERASVAGLALHGSVLDTVRGASAFAGGSVSIDATQVVGLGAALLADAGVAVTDRPD